MLVSGPFQLIRPTSSPARCGPHNVAAAAADVVEAVAELGRPPDVVIGHSFGGKVAAGTLRLLHALSLLINCLTMCSAAGRTILCGAEPGQPQSDMGSRHAPVLILPLFSAADAPSQTP
jgi:pimeloyl-ACP methyl ester carboxylesterase